MNIRTTLQNRVREAMTSAGVPIEFDAHVAPSKNPSFGDYQANGAMAAAKAMRCAPRELAQRILDALALHDIAHTVEIAGPGFINIHLDPKWLAQHLRELSEDPRLGVPETQNPRVAVIDYSSPNLAKEMHVGHLRSTIIGDAVARVREFSGDTVVRQNHVGDWGTQFGMLIAELEDQLSHGEAAELALKDLESFYQAAKKHFDSDDNFATRARDYVVKLQSGDAHVLSLWQRFREISLAHAKALYHKLNVSLESEHIRGESAYNDDLQTLVNRLKALSLATQDDGALVVFLDELADKDGKPSAVIVQKKDGGFLYATTDLAALRYRTTVLGANSIEYFIDDRQSLHMKQVFTLARKAGFVEASTQLEHRVFGKILGKDGKPFKTRSGDTVKLDKLLDEAVERAHAIVLEKNPDLDVKSAREAATNVGIGAVKYADLCKTRTNDYIFDWDAMLSFEGNTGPYLQYAYARICSIFRRAKLDLTSCVFDVELKEQEERALALKLLRFPETLEQVCEDAYPHILCTYLYELASTFSSFYEACPILKDHVELSDRDSRLQLCKASARILEKGLTLLGIKVMDRM